MLKVKTKLFKDGSRCKQMMQKRNIKGREKTKKIVTEEKNKVTEQGSWGMIAEVTT